MITQADRGDAAHPNRASHVIEAAVDDDLLLYDSSTHQAFRLNESAASVWRRCDGRTPVQEILQGDRAAWDLLARLSADGLVIGVPASPPKQAVSRRSFVRAGAAVAAGAAMTPIIEGILVPTPAAAFSGTTGGTGGTGGAGGGGGGGTTTWTCTKTGTYNWTGKCDGDDWTCRKDDVSHYHGTYSGSASFSWTATKAGTNSWSGTFQMTLFGKAYTVNWTAGLSGGVWSGTISVVGMPGSTYNWSSAYPNANPTWSTECVFLSDLAPWLSTNPS